MFISTKKSESPWILFRTGFQALGGLDGKPNDKKNPVRLLIDLTGNQHTNREQFTYKRGRKALYINIPQNFVDEFG